MKVSPAALNGRSVGAAVVNGNLLWHIVKVARSKSCIAFVKCSNTAIN